MKKQCALAGLVIAGLIAAAGWIMRSPPDEMADGSTTERDGKPSSLRADASAPAAAVQDREENRWAPGTQAERPSPVSQPVEDAVRRLLADVTAGRLILDTDEEGFDVLDLQRPDAVPVIVRLWAQKNWAEASRWAQALPESGIKSASLRQLAVVRLKTDPAAAFAWVEALAAGPSRAAAVETMATEFASADPGQAMQLAEELPAGASRDQTLSHIYSQWSAQDPSAAVVSARVVADPAARARALAAVAAAWADTDPASAGTLAAQEIDDPVAQTRAVASIVQRWAKDDPAAAAAWVQKFEPGDVANGAVEQLVVQWSRQDADAAGRWLISLPNTAVRDLGLATLARAIAPSNPALAAQSAALITDPASRQRCMAALGSH